MAERARVVDLERYTRLWWVRLPLRARRLSRSAPAVLTDGLYLAASSQAGAIAPPAALILGLFVGSLHPGFEHVFSESTGVLLLVTATGILSGSLGAAWLLGYAMGDLTLVGTALLSSHEGVSMARVVLPQLIEYGVLGLLLVHAPVLTKVLLVHLMPAPWMGRALSLGFAVVAHAAITGVLVFFWTQAAPILIRPLYTWQGSAPTAAAVAPLQFGWEPLVRVAVVASLARMGMQGLAASRRGRSERVAALEAELATAPPVEPLVQRTPAWIRVAMHAAWATLLLAGMMGSWFDAFLLGGLLLLTQAARAGLVPVPLGTWPERIARVPLPLRLVAGFGVVFLVSRWTLFPLARSLALEFQPVVLLTAFALLVLYLLVPGAPAARVPGPPAGAAR